LLSHSPRAPQVGDTIVLPARAARPRVPCAGLLRTTEQESCQPSRARGCSRHARYLRATGVACQSHGPSYSLSQIERVSYGTPVIPTWDSGSSRAKTYGSVLHAIFQLLAERSCTSKLRLNIRGLPGARHKSKQSYVRGLS